MRPLELSPLFALPGLEENTPSPEVFSAAVELEKLFRQLESALFEGAAHSDHATLFRKYPQLLPLRGLAKESDPELFYEDLFRLALELGREGSLNLRQLILMGLVQQELPASLRDRVTAEAERRPWEDTLPVLLQESLDPKFLSALAVGRLAFEPGRRLGWELFHPLLITPARMEAAGHLGGFFAETTAFHSAWYFFCSGFVGAPEETIPSWEDSWLGSGLFFASIHSVQWLGRRIYPNPGPLEKVTTLAMQFTGLSLALDVEARFHGAAFSSWRELMEASLVGWLQWQICDGFFPAVAHPSPTLKENFRNPGASLEVAFWEMIPAGPRNETVHWMAGDQTPPSHDFRRNFPPPGPHVFTREILAAWEATALPLPEFRQRLLEAYARAPNRGSREQWHTALAVQKLFQFDALNTSQGSWDNALLQLLFGQTLALSANARRNHLLQELFQLMEGGWNREKFLNFSFNHELGGGFAGQLRPQFSEIYYRRHFSLAAREWGHLSGNEKRLLWNQIFLESEGASRLSRKWIRQWGRFTHPDYPGSSANRRVLEAATLHRHGRLMLRRLHRILIQGDHPGKARELWEYPADAGTPGLFTSRSGTEPAWENFQNASHDAFMNDDRLAKKMVSVFNEIQPYLANASVRLEGVEQFRRSLLENYAGVLDTRLLLQLLERHPTSASVQLLEAHRLGLVNIEILPEGQFLKMQRRWSREAQVDMGFYRPQNILGRPDDLILREMRPLMVESAADGDVLVFEVGRRLKALIHEFEHWRHFRGYFTGVELGSSPFPMKDISRHERLVTEMMAVLEEQRWTNRYFGVDLWRTASRLSPHWTVFLRDVHGIAYPPRGYKP